MDFVANAPGADNLEWIFRRKHGPLRLTGWGPRTRSHFGYFTPDEHYEAVVARHVKDGCAWLDVGGGRDLFPDNAAFAHELAQRCRLLVAVDPSDTLDENRLAHQRVKAKIEDFASDERFDLATLRMVAEHIEDPEASVAALASVVKPGGKVVIYTINRWSPVPLVSWLTPFWVHHPVKQLLWDTEEKDTFPVVYRMNTRRRLASLFRHYHFREEYFAYLDDCRTFHRFRLLHAAELLLWRVLRMTGITYPENCLLGVYEKVGGR
jgi:SAM-dependent methyltransferase